MWLLSWIYVKMDINNRDGNGIISAIGKVRWANMLMRKAPLDEKVGIEFIDIRPEDRERISEIVEEILKKQRRK